MTKKKEQKELFYYLDSKDGTPMTAEGMELFKTMFSDSDLKEIEKRLIEVQATRSEIGTFMSRQDVAAMSWFKK